MCTYGVNIKINVCGKALVKAESLLSLWIQDMFRWIGIQFGKKCQVSMNIIQK